MSPRPPLPFLVTSDEEKMAAKKMLPHEVLLIHDAVQGKREIERNRIVVGAADRDGARRGHRQDDRKGSGVGRRLCEVR
ncbi:hypothetical protein BHM03_00008678 [Ensete ventricosum]|uniref:Uncharacterized protein n=1 Tax=Ensete ventricosum TaxID=4639 RepID=A0A445MCB7_ENSVE|nr:hypothetical protein BHM03_00008678 [Ensete ventricosum]